MDLREKYYFEFYLSSLKSNLPEEISATLPTLDEISAGENHGAFSERITALLRADVISRFYAAVLSKAGGAKDWRHFVAEAENDETPLRVQKSLGFGAFEMPLGLLAQDFLSGGDVPGENFLRGEKLSHWASAVSAEKRQTAPDFDSESLPKLGEIFDARKNGVKKEALDRSIERLTRGSVAERFYAAALAGYFDEDKARDILETLLNEHGEIGVLSGDTMMNFPASKVAAKLLGRNISDSPANEFQNPVARFFKWLGG